MSRKSLLALFVAVLGFALPSVASACEHCALLRICVGDECWWTSLCKVPSYPTAGWSECDDTWVPCTNGGVKCQWVFAPRSEEDAADAMPAGA